MKWPHFRSSERFCEVDPFLRSGVVSSKDEHGSVKHGDPHSAEGESHDGTGTEGGVETLGPSRLLCSNGGTDVGIYGDLHSKVSRSHRGKCTEQEGNGSHASTSVVPSGSPRNKNKDENSETSYKPKANRVLGLQEGLSTLVNSLVNFFQARSCGLVIRTTFNKSVFLSTICSGNNWDLRNDLKLEIAPHQGNDGRSKYEGRCPSLRHKSKSIITEYYRD